MPASIPACPQRNRQASRRRKSSRQRDVVEAWAAIPRGQSYSYNAPLRGQPAYLVAFGFLISAGDRVALAILGSSPNSFFLLLNSSFPRSLLLLSSFFANGRSRRGELTPTS